MTASYGECESKNITDNGKLCGILNAGEFTLPFWTMDLFYNDTCDLINLCNNIQEL